jgi:citrate lyase subunit gamma (acyl carrier protein)
LAKFKKERIYMDILKRASAGTLESSDAYIEIEPGQNGLDIQLESVVQEQFGDEICRVVREVLEEGGVSGANVRVVDRGALECVIRARVETAILRGKGDA